MPNQTRTIAIVAAVALSLACCKSQEGIQPEAPAAGGGPASGGAAGSENTSATGGTSGGGVGAGGTGGGAGTANHACPTGLAGPALVEIPGPNGSAYCMDAREVTQAEYAAFLDAKKDDVSGQPKECALNTHWAPQVQEGGDMSNSSDCPQGFYDPASFPDRPMLCANWCKAKAYCEWAGKRLCGRIGGGTLGIATDPASASNPMGEWYNACSQGGKTTYAYGDTYQPSTCNGPDNPASGDKLPPQISTKDSTCHGASPPFDQVFDLTGNVYEWEACDLDGDATLCHLRGGSFNDDPSQAKNYEKCGFGAVSDVISADNTTGIRCCAD